MSPNQRNPSYTLPRNFTFHFNDADAESASAHQNQTVPEPPSPIRPYRLRRRRAPKQLTSEQFVQPESDVPIPTIEVVGPLITRQDVHHHQSFVSNTSSLRRSPPRTPVPQSDPSLDDDTMAMDNTETASQAESISRPSTACSGFSDSSDCSSIESFPSTGASFASPECDRSDRNAGFVMLDGAVAQSAAVNQVRKMLPAADDESPSKQTWSEEMDNHLWTTYMKYLQDPRHTPFKMLPGTSPPLGVCSRVAREAKRSWKGRHTRAALRVPSLKPQSSTAQADSPDTIRATHSGSVTPTDQRSLHAEIGWPRSDAATRRRLRELCKSKPSLAAHYHRLLVTRSPSPFMDDVATHSHLSTDGPIRSSSCMAVHQETPAAAFSTRDMSLSLFSSTSVAVSAMSQLTAQSEDPTATGSSSPPLPPPMPASSQSRPTVMRHYGHQKSRSLHSNIYPGSSYRGREGLASPFQPARRSYTALRKSSRDAFQTPLASNLRLTSPVPLAAPKQRSRPSLRQFFNQDQDAEGPDRMTRRPFPDVDVRTAALAGRRARSRAASMVDVSASSRRLSLLFEPSTAQEPPAMPQLMGPNNSTPLAFQLPQISSLPSVARRLGSPFTEKPARPLYNTFPRNFSLHGLEPALEISEEREVHQSPHANVSLDQALASGQQ